MSKFRNAVRRFFAGEDTPSGDALVSGDPSAPDLFVSEPDDAVATPVAASAVTKPAGVDPKGDDAADDQEGGGSEVEAPKKRKDRTILWIMIAILVIIGACVGLYMVFVKTPALRNRMVAPTTVAQATATPTVAVPVAGNPTQIPTIKPTGIPTQIPPAIPTVDAPVIMTVSQVGAGADIMAGWDDPKATVKLPISDASTWKGIASSKEGQAFYVVAVSSDPGSVVFGGQNYAFPDEGFVAVFVTTTPLSVEITTSFNQANGHFNCWAEKYVIPSTQNVDQAAKTILQEWQEREKKPVAFAILSDGTVFKIK